ncbi:unnamed protein product, partial [Closterium sp. Naga37s-1]
TRILGLHAPLLLSLRRPSAILDHLQRALHLCHQGLCCAGLCAWALLRPAVLCGGRWGGGAVCGGAPHAAGSRCCCELLQDRVP